MSPGAMAVQRGSPAREEGTQEEMNVKTRIALVGLCAVLAGIAGCPMDETPPGNDNGNTNQNVNDNTPDTVSVTGTGTWTLAEGDLENIRNAMVYLNIHTDNNLAGEIRGQVTAGDDADTFVVELSGDNEVPPVTTDATGTATLTLSENETTITFQVDAEGLSSSVTGAHFHLGAEGVNGDIIFPITDRIVEQ
jgi:hypothetical protein